MNFNMLLSTLRARKGVALLVFLLTVGTAVAVSLLMPKQYTATAAIVVDPRSDPLGSPNYFPLVTPALLSTQVEILKSNRVAQRVVHEMRLTEQPKAREKWLESTHGEGSFETWLVEGLQKKMDVTPSRDSNVISVSFKAPDPLLAASTANALVKAFLEVVVELRVDPAKQYSQFFDSRAKELRANLERAQARLSAFQREKGIIVSDERLDLETQQLNQLAAQLTVLQAMSAESGSRQAQALGGSGDRLQEVVNNPMLAALRADLTRTEGRLQELNSRLGDNHPQVVEAKANIATLRGRLEVETRRVTGSVGVTNTINRAKEAEIRAALDAQRARVLRMKTVRDEGAVMYRDVENAQRAYEAVLSRLNQATTESQATQSNVYLLTEATPPIRASSPKVLLNTVLAIAFGAALAGAAAIAIEAIDRRVRSVDEVVDLVGLPVLGVLPEPDAKAFVAVGGARLVTHRLPDRSPASHQEA